MRTAPVRSHNKKLIYLPGKQAAGKKKDSQHIVDCCCALFSLLCRSVLAFLQLRRALAELQAEIQIEGTE